MTILSILFPRLFGGTYGIYHSTADRTALSMLDDLAGLDGMSFSSCWCAAFAFSLWVPEKTGLPSHTVLLFSL